MEIIIKRHPVYSILNLTFDILLLIFSIIFASIVKYGAVQFNQVFVNFVPLYLFAWLITTIITKRYKQRLNYDCDARLKYITIFSLYMIGILSLLLYGFKWFQLSRLVVWGSVSWYLFFQVLIISLPYLLYAKVRKLSDSAFSVPFFIIGFILIISVFWSFNFFNGNYLNHDKYLTPVIAIVVLWILLSLTLQKFIFNNPTRYLRTIWPFIKTDLILVAGISFFTYTLQLHSFPRKALIIPFLGFSVLELGAVSIYYLYKKPKETDETETEILDVPLVEVAGLENYKSKFEIEISEKYHLPENNTSTSERISQKLKNIYLVNKAEVYDFISNAIELDNLKYLSSEIINSANPYNFEILPDKSFNFILNLHVINDFRRLNSYLIKINEKLVQDGIFVSRFESLENRKELFRIKYPYYVASTAISIDFIWKRLFPKLPVLKKIYFAISKGEDRILSKAEALGRLHYCGFKILALKEIEHFNYFIAQKVQKPVTDRVPSYGPLFKMRRTGKNGKPILVYKFRTMYPYSEYLQSFITNFNGYAKNGKIQNDFRVANWGKVLRKYWLDEIPQVINVLKGEMNIVGIRPLSDQFLKEYPEEFLKLREKYKPGCIPPYVALRMQEVQKYIESEKIYLNEKSKRPIFTDIKYFFWAIYNILTNKIRSA